MGGEGVGGGGGGEGEEGWGCLEIFLLLIYKENPYNGGPVGTPLTCPYLGNSIPPAAAFLRAEEKN